MVRSSPAVAGGVLYVGSFDHRLYAFDASGCGAAACSPLWTGRGGEIFSSPAVADGVVYVGANDGKLYAYDLVAGPTAPARPTATTLRPNYRLPQAQSGRGPGGRRRCGNQGADGIRDQ
jgi:hypothetical protein